MEHGAAMLSDMRVLRVFSIGVDAFDRLVLLIFFVGGSKEEESSRGARRAHKIKKGG